MPTERLSRVLTYTKSLTHGTCSLVNSPLEETRKPRASRALQAVSNPPMRLAGFLSVSCSSPRC
jgi:hypothetical protein